MDLTKEREGVEHNDGAVYNVARACVVSEADGPHISDAIVTNRTFSDWP